jgi:hypothetical protein
MIGLHVFFGADVLSSDKRDRHSSFIYTSFLPFPVNFSSIHFLPLFPPSYAPACTLMLVSIKWPQFQSLSPDGGREDAIVGVYNQPRVGADKASAKYDA